MATFSLPVAHKPPPVDNCGACTACCILPGMPELGKPFYARCVHLRGENEPAGCGIYETRPKRCREFRCAWHLNMMGSRLDRRPDKCGLMVQVEPGSTGEWYLTVFELNAGAATDDRVRYLCDIILSSKQTRHLRFGQPAIRIIRYGSAVPTDFPISMRFDDPGPGPDATFTQTGNAMVFHGRVRDVLIPKPE